MILSDSLVLWENAFPVKQTFMPAGAGTKNHESPRKEVEVYV